MQSSLPSIPPVGKALAATLLGSPRSVYFIIFFPESQQYLHPRRTGVFLRQPPHPEGAVQLLLAQAELIAMHGTYTVG